MRILLLLLCLSGSLTSFAQQIYVSREAQISFFSSAPIENIEANTNKGVSAINIADGTIFFKVPVKSFQFEKGLMQQHFNSDYMESGKFPYAEFKGRILGPFQVDTVGLFPVTVSGQLTIHGVTRPYKTQGTIEVKNGRFTGKAVFKVRLADHEIKIPRLLTRNIAEVVEVKVNAVYQPEAVAAVSSGSR